MLHNHMVRFVGKEKDDERIYTIENEPKLSDVIDGKSEKLNKWNNKRKNRYMILGLCPELFNVKKSD